MNFARVGRLGSEHGDPYRHHYPGHFQPDQPLSKHFTDLHLSKIYSFPQSVHSRDRSDSHCGALSPVSFGGGGREGLCKEKPDMDLLEESAALSLETLPLFFAIFLSARVRCSTRIHQGMAVKWPHARFHTAETLCRAVRCHLFFSRNRRALLDVTCSES